MKRKYMQSEESNDKIKRMKTEKDISGSEDVRI
jgi:hypothetical protein